MVFYSLFPLAISDISANIITTYDYDAYGNVSLTSGSQAFQNDRLFTGREYEKETGLYYYRARFYSPKTGRFLSRDPIGIQDDVNLYAYVGNNPVMFTDPSGMTKRATVIIADDSDDNEYVLRDGYLTNQANSATRQLYNTLRKQNPDVNYDIVFVKNFEGLDNAINNSKTNNLYILGHGNDQIIALNYSNGAVVDRVGMKELGTDVQTKEENERLAEKTLTLFSFNTGNISEGKKNTAEKLLEHYNFKEVYAPSGFMNGNHEIYAKEEIVTSFMGVDLGTEKVKIPGQMNLFTK